MSEMDEIIREFLIESNEGLDTMDRDLVELEKDSDSKELLGNIFRAIHTIKGTSGVLGFPRLEAVAHVGENLLSRMRDGKLRLLPEITTALLTMVDAIRTMLVAIENTGRDGDRDFPEVIAAISSFLVPTTRKPAVADPSPEPVVEPAALIGELLVQSGISSDAVAEALHAQSDGDPRRLGEILIAKGDVKPETVLDALNKQGENRPATVSGSIRVDVGLLDKVMNLVGELVLARNHSMALVKLRQRLTSVAEPAVPPPLLAAHRSEAAWKRY